VQRIRASARLQFVPGPIHILLRKCLLDLRIHDLLERFINLALEKTSQSSILARDVVPEEHDVENDGDGQAEEGDDPND
jgi:hypothetical protein